ncbi:hypothetical protein V5O48_014181 [Marasmius crinis-equi]|uniref:Uncharacterized protein n=1 Tax=Marasmius crinis-equi TaxID=585013 RepID=A0ABR3EY10_9AGAR
MMSHPNINFNGGQSFNNWDSGVQNINQGRDQILYRGSGTMNIHNESGRREVSPDPDATDKPLTPVKLKQERKSFARLKIGELPDSELAKIDSQDYLNRWQRMIISDPTGSLIPPPEKAGILDAMARLSDISKTAPKCLRVQDVGINLSNEPLPDTQVFRGKFGDLDVAVKALENLDPKEDQLKVDFQSFLLGFS